MSIAQAEKLKHDLTDKYVLVKDGVPELRRFAGLTGQVKTVNMNGQALVQFDNPVDISWYDIHPNYLQVVAAPLPKKAAQAEKEAKPAAEKPAAKAAPAAGKSPLEQARAQGAGGGAKPAAAGEKKLSPIELARQQGAGGAAKPAAAPAAAGGKKMSPLELARQQGAAKAEGAAPAAPPPPAPVAQQAPPPAPAPVAAAPKAAAAKSALHTPGSTAEIIALARQQGAFKG